MNVLKVLVIFLLSISILLNSACSIVPLPVSSDEDNLTPVKPVALTADIPITDNKVAPQVENIQLAKQIPLQPGSSESSKVYSASIETVDAIELSLMPAKLTQKKKSMPAKDSLQQGISLLKDGKIAAAKQVFEKVLTLQQKNKTALKMLRQIRLKPQKYFANKSFTSRYQVRVGDTFSTIASQFLGDSLDFHSLAKLNNRKNINDIKAGDVILVPLTDPIVEKAKKSTKINSQVRPARQKLGQKPSQKPSQIPKKVVTLIPPKSRPLTTRDDKQDKAKQLYQSGMNALVKGHEYEAFTAFEKTLLLQPNNDMARKQLMRLKPSVTEFLHAKAMLLYKDQKIKSAIGNWDRVLMIDSEHELARVYRGRAIELQKRLDKLPKTN